jgi:hypothetical protein
MVFHHSPLKPDRSHKAYGGDMHGLIMNEWLNGMKGILVLLFLKKTVRYYDEINTD